MYSTHFFKNTFSTMDDILDKGFLKCHNIDNSCNYVVLDEDDVIKLQTPLPGRVKEELSIKIKKSILSISAKSSDKNHWTKEDVNLQWKINESIIADKTTASLENGILTVTLYKKDSNEFNVNLS